MILTTTSAQERWDQVIVDLEKRLERARAIRSVLGDDELADELAKIFGNEGAKRLEKPTEDSSGASTIYAYVTRFFVKNNNEWSTISEMIKGTKIRRDSVRGLIYKGRIDSFDKRKHPNPPGGPGSAKLAQFKGRV